MCVGMCVHIVCEDIHPRELSFVLVLGLPLELTPWFGEFYHNGLFIYLYVRQIFTH